MVGANYMGGKRNNVRKKNGDVIGRYQKQFFGKQRHDLLTKGLGRTPSNLARKSTGLLRTQSITSIQLAHAPHDLADASDTQTAFISQKKRPSSSDIRPSKLLEELDASEPIQRRAALAKILALPDLAGLNYYSQSRNSSSSCSLKRKRTDSSTTSFEKHVKTQKAFYSKDIHAEIPNQTTNSNKSDQDLDSMELNFGTDSRDFHSDVDSQPDAYSDVLPPSSPDYSFEQSSDLYGYPIKDSERSVFYKLISPGAEGRLISPYRRKHPATQFPDKKLESVSSYHNSSDSVLREQLSESLSSLQSQNSTLASPNIDYSGKPFEYEDPWRIAGVVMGLEEFSESPFKYKVSWTDGEDQDVTTEQNKPSHSSSKQSPSIKPILKVKPNSSSLIFTSPTYNASSSSSPCSGLGKTFTSSPHITQPSSSSSRPSVRSIAYRSALLPPNSPISTYLISPNAEDDNTQNIIRDNIARIPAPSNDNSADPQDSPSEDHDHITMQPSIEQVGIEALYTVLDDVHSPDSIHDTIALSFIAPPQSLDNHTDLQDSLALIAVEGQSTRQPCVKKVDNEEGVFGEVQVELPQSLPKKIYGLFAGEESDESDEE